MPNRAGPPEGFQLCEWCTEYAVPRAVVAISDDRQWLVVLESEFWWVYEQDRRSQYPRFVLRHCGASDTGQDAHEVLREFLEGRK